jgi:hypothetical protein
MVLPVLPSAPLETDQQALRQANNPDMFSTFSAGFIKREKMPCPTYRCS